MIKINRFLQDDGIGVPFKKEYEPDYVLIRKDGWILACKKRNLNVAKAMWQESWVAIIEYKKITDLFL